MPKDKKDAPTEQRGPKELSDIAARVELDKEGEDSPEWREFIRRRELNRSDD